MSTIKGITIELDGDTTRLSKAIKDVNTTTRDLNKELRSINSSLKFNPDSMELMEQKARVTGEAVENLKEKLGTLKTAQEQAATALENGDIGQSAYDALTREIIKTENQIKSYTNQLEELSKVDSSSIEASKNRREALGELSKEYEQLEDKSKKIQKEYELEQAQMGQNASAAEKLRAEKENLGKQLEVTAEEVINLEKQLEIAKEEFGENSEEVSQLEDKLLDANIAFAEMATELEGLGGSLSELSAEVNQVGEGLVELGKGTMKITAPFMALTAVGVKSYADLEQALSHVQAVSGATASEMERLEELAREMGASTKFSATEAGDALTYLATAGWTVEEMMSGLPGLLDLAAASGTDLAQTANIVAGAVSAFSMEAGEAGRLADVLAAASANSNTNVEMMGDAFSNAGSVAGAFGYSIEDVSLALGLMANKTVKGATAGTQLSSALSRMVKPTGEAKQLMDSYGISIADTQGNMRPLREVLMGLRTAFADMSEEQKGQAATTIFGQNAMKGMLAILNSSEREFQNMIQAIDNSEGAAANMADTMQNNLWGAFDQLKSSVTEMAMSIGDNFVPVIEAVARGITNIVDAYNSLGEGTKMVIGIFVGLIAILGPLLLIVGKLLIGIGTFAGLMATLTGGAAAVTPAIAAMAQGVGALAGVMAKIKGVIAIVAGALSIKLVLAIMAVVTAVGLLIKFWPQVKEFFSGLGEKAKEAGEKIKDGLAQDIERAKEIISRTFNDIVRTAKSTWDNISKAVSDGVKAVVDKAKEIGSLRNLISSIWNVIKNLTSSAWENVKSLVQSAVDKVKQTISNFGESISETWSNILEKTKEIWESIKEAVQKPIDEMLEKVKSFMEKVKEIFNTELKFPEVKMPKFKAAGNFGTNPPSVPKFDVSWHKEGGIFTRPTIFNTPGGLHGVGEAGAEAVLPIEKLSGILAETMEQIGVGNQFIFNVSFDEISELRDFVEMAKSAERLKNMGGEV